MVEQELIMGEDAPSLIEVAGDPAHKDENSD